MVKEEKPISKIDIYQRGMRGLDEILGTVDAETFSAMIKSENLDYTEWRRTHLPEYDDVEDLLRDAEELTLKLDRLGADAVKQIALGGYTTFKEREAAIDAKLKSNAAPA